MPDLWTHYFFAKEVMIENHLKDLKTDVYYLGAQGPDVLLYLDFYPWKKKDEDYEGFGNLIHGEKTEEVLKLVFLMLENQNQKLRSYLYGFLTHYALDATTHPFVYYHAATDDEHKKLEMTLDVAMYKKRRSRKLTKQDATVLFNVGKDLPQEVVGFYQLLGREVFNTEVTEEVLQRAYHDMLAYHRLTRANTLTKKIFLSTFNNFSKINIDTYIYKNDVDTSVLTPEMFEEFVEGYDKAKVFYKKLIQDRKTQNTVNFEGRFIE